MANVNLIVMQSSQANLVRGLTVPGHALAPSPTLSGPFVLPFECASDPYHSARTAFLTSFPHFTLASSDLWPVQESSSIGSSNIVTWPTSMKDLVLHCTYASSWPAGQTIAVST